MAATAEGGLHLEWFTDGSERAGIQYGYSTGTTPGSTQAVRVRTMDAAAGASHLQVLEYGSRVYYAWKRFDGERTLALVMPIR